MNNYLRIKMVNVVKLFKNELTHARVLDEINVEFEQGVSYAIQGISGVGKTTLINILSGLDIPSSGAVLYNHYNINKAEHAQFLQSAIGLIFQEAYLLHELTILENVMIKNVINKNKKNDEEWAYLLLEFLQIRSKVTCYPHQLSGGEQQRVSIARALFHKPMMLIADEPTAHLDKESKQLVIDLLLRAKNNYGMGLVVSTHDPMVAEAMDFTFKLENGKLVTI